MRAADVAARLGGVKAMILAGGLSTRLYPLTKYVPKPLVPVAGEPNAVHVIRYLRSFGVVDIALNVHYLADQIEEKLGDGAAYGVRLHYLREPELLGSAGAVKQMEGFLDDTFVVVGCDDLTDLRLDALVAFHKRREALATIALAQADDVSQYGVVVLDGEGCIVEFQEKPAPGTERSHLVNTGIYVFEPAILERIPEKTFFDFGRDVFPALQRDRARFFGLSLPGAYWCDIGTPSEYRRASRDVLSGRARLLGSGRARGVPSDARLGDDVWIEEDVRVGARCTIGDGVRLIGPTVIGDDVVIGARARIEASIVWDGALIGAGAHVKDSILGNHYVVPDEPEPATA
jgi:NDP-sugar pyrophosphorylase family protein